MSNSPSCAFVLAFVVFCWPCLAQPGVPVVTTCVNKSPMLFLKNGKDIDSHATSTAIWNLGEISHLDPDPVRVYRANGYSQSGYTQSFFFKNISPKPIFIAKYISDCFSSDLYFQGEKVPRLSGICLSGQTVEAAVAFHPVFLSPGRWDEQVQFVDAQGKQLFGVRVLVNLIGGVSFEKGSCDFGVIRARHSATRDFRVHLKKELPQNLPPKEPLIFETNNPLFKVEKITLIRPDKGVTSKNNAILFNNAWGTTLTHDLTAVVRVRVQPRSRTGAFRIMLEPKLKGFPYYVSLMKSGIQLRVRVTK